MLNEEAVRKYGLFFLREGRFWKDPKGKILGRAPHNGGNQIANDTLVGAWARPRLGRPARRRERRGFIERCI